MNALVAVASLVLCVIAVEVIARLILSDIGTTGDRGTYHSQRWYAENPPRENHLGFRDRSFAAHPGPGDFRIAMVGDSFTFGAGILEHDRISNLLQDSMNDQGKGRFEVLNFGQPGANYEELEKNMRVAIREANPHFILLQWYLNDLDDRQDRRPKPKQLGSILHHDLISFSVLYFLVSHAFSNAQVMVGFIDADAYYARFLDAEDPISTRAMARFRGVVDVARDAGVPIAVFAWPDLTRPLSGNPSNPVIDWFLMNCRELSIECVDLRAALKKEPNHERLVVNRFDAHASAFANRMAAELLLQTLGPEWLALSEEIAQ